MKAVRQKLLAALGWLANGWRALWGVLRRIGRVGGLLLAGIFLPISWPLRVLVWPLVRPLWRFLGRLGLALRQLIVWLFWPFKASFNFLINSLKWLGQTTRSALRARWQAGAPARQRQRRRWASWWLVRRARWRVLFRRPSSVPQALVAPAVPQPATTYAPRSFLATFVTVNLVLLALGYIYVELNPPPPSAADASLATPLPTYTPTVTPTPTPATIALTPWPTPDPLISGGSVAFTLRQNGNSDLYVLSLGQDEPMRLTNHPAIDRDPAWRPDGRQLAFTSNRGGNWDIYVLDMPTGNITRITRDLEFDGGATWSPDGQWLIYEAYRQNNLDIYIVKADRSEGPFRLTEHPAPDFAPVWAPDGRHIAFTSWRNGNKEIFLMSLDAVGDDRAFNLTDTAEQFEDAAAFHPTGQAIAYHDTSRGYELVYVQELDANYRPVGRPISLGQGREPSWSPNGQSLAFLHTIDQQQYLLASSIDAWSVAPQTYATNAPLADPSWSAITLVQEPTGFLREMALAYDPPLFTETISPTLATQAPYRLLELDVQAPYPFLSDRVEQSFLALRQRALQTVGWDVLAQLGRLYEPLDTRPALGQSGQTWHKAGRAFDLDYETALAFTPEMEIMRHDSGNETYWHVYLRAAVQDGSQGEPLRDLPWDFRARFGANPSDYDQGGAWRETIPTGYYVDFTQLAADYGWERVPALPSWRTYFPNIRFWQFERREDLTWEEAMRELYTTQELLDTFGRQ